MKRTFVFLIFHLKRVLLSNYTVRTESWFWDGSGNSFIWHY